MAAVAERERRPGSCPTDTIGCEWIAIKRATPHLRENRSNKNDGNY